MDTVKNESGATLSRYPFNSEQYKDGGAFKIYSVRVSGYQNRLASTRQTLSYDDIITVLTRLLTRLPVRYPVPRVAARTMKGGYSL